MHSTVLIGRAVVERAVLIRRAVVERVVLIRRAVVTVLPGNNFVNCRSTGYKPC